MSVVAFAVLAVIALGSALGLVFRKNAIHGALFLVVNLGTVAALYLSLGAEFLAVAYGMLGDREAAFRQLDRALEQRSAGMIYLHLDPLYDSLRDDPRLSALIATIGLQ